LHQLINDSRFGKTVKSGIRKTVDRDAGKSKAGIPLAPQPGLSLLRPYAPPFLRLFLYDYQP